MQVQVVVLAVSCDLERGGQPSPQSEKRVAITCAAHLKYGALCLVSHFGTLVLFFGHAWRHAGPQFPKLCPLPWKCGALLTAR